MDKPHGRDEVVEAVIRAAIPLIAERGVKAVTFRDVAQAANINHGLITRHFGTKEGLVGQVSNHLVRLFLDAAKLTRPEDMGPLWQVVRANREAARAFARIVQETAPDPGSQHATDSVLGEVVGWLRGSLNVDAEASSARANLTIYLLAVLFFGGETFGLHLQQALKLSEAEFLALREDSFALVLGNAFADKKG